MPVYNGDRFLNEAIQSILSQTYENLELIIVNDCSSDNSVDQIKSFEDKRIVLIDNEENIGCGSSLNKAIDASQGTYIARMDCDDIAAQERLAKQVKFMQENTSYGVVGTHYRLINEHYNGKEKARKVIIPISDEAIRFRLLTHFPFCHPSIMFRASLFTDKAIRYSNTLRYGEDIDLIIKLKDKTMFYNMPESLFYYRKHENSITTKKANATATEKLPVIQQYHEPALTKEFLESDSYNYLMKVYLFNEWNLVKNDPVFFEKSLHGLASSYINKNSINAPKYIYGYASELLLRVLLFQGRSLKTLALTPYILLKNKNLIHLFRHVLHTFSLYK